MGGSSSGKIRTTQFGPTSYSKILPNEEGGFPFSIMYQPSTILAVEQGRMNSKRLKLFLQG
jgi:hypothetical protein